MENNKIEKKTVKFKDMQSISKLTVKCECAREMRLRYLFTCMYLYIYIIHTYIHILYLFYLRKHFSEIFHNADFHIYLQ